jgi:GT2 family glycosyltransferase
MKPDLNISIVVYNTSFNLIKRLINQLLENNLNFKIFIIDNSEQPFLKEKINNELNFSNLYYKYNNANFGYGKAHNIAIKETIKDDIPYHLVINPDVQLGKEILDKIFKFMEENKNIGNLMPKVLYPDKRIQYLAKLLPNPYILFGRRFLPLQKVKKVIDYYYELHFFNYNDLLNVPNLSGCFMFLRTNILRKIGMFDERYFMYMEDVDLNRRIHSVSETIFYPNVNIIHDYGKGSYKSKKLMKFHVESAIRYFNKWGWLVDKERNKFNKNLFKRLGEKINYLFL